eukprot:CAMPEP_0119299234 /NCGR_PEP_ID=MMETSP1333-20130426/1344_1 /TAXON_ID=418940 /ORGANISM="Scyphosphaera apsteinii, Strain RCC1455" /LENGTH=518 /DNA_ID=CAMNT_0007300601 /DNA_START=189 /DNA_END=1745 /DNA_ORIENTATION=+
MDFVRIPNVSPAFDETWDTNGLQMQAFDLVTKWAEAQNLNNCKIELLKDAARTPLLVMEIEAHDSEKVCMLYAHIDKQPPMGVWMEGLGPYEPAVKEGKLYGRGAVDDGYGFYCAITSIKAIQAQGLPCPRIVMLFEGCEESGSRDLPYYMDKLSDRIGTPDLICCLDAGCGNYEQLWMTTSLRGCVAVNLTAQMLMEGAHSGTSSGIVPSSFRICRELLSRLEDEKTGLVVPEEFHVEVPLSRVKQVSAAAEILGETVVRQFSFVEGGHPVAKDAPVSEHILARTWRPALSVIGCDGLPPTRVAGNVMLPFTKLKLSMRLPPTLDAPQAMQRLERILTSDPPQGARITLEPVATGNGWHAPLEEEWLNEAVHTASLTYFDKPCAHMGEGGSIPFMGMLLDMFPKAQFLVTGAAGPGSNMHAPNEFLHIDYSARLAMCVAQVVATLATKKPGEAASKDAAAVDAGDRKSFLESFQQSGGKLFFVGCDCGTAGCVIFDQGKEMVCRPVKQLKTGGAVVK